MTSWWCEQAVLPEGPTPAVLIEADDRGRITTVTPNSSPSPGAVHLDGLTVPGFANAHSHAFHRALRGRVQAERGTFWTWRETMYRAAERLQPDSYHRLARAVFAEMAEAGISTVGEFHYLHHRVGGASYDDPNAMGHALLSAADEVGIRITLLDTIYLFGGLTDNGYTPPAGVQTRYCDESFERWADRVRRLEDTDTHRIGAAIHSIRAVDPETMSLVADWADRRTAPLHAHVSEQTAENQQSIQAHGLTPVAVLDKTKVLSPHFTAVHATHLTEADIDALARSSSMACFCPTTEQDLGDGVGPAAELVDAGVRLCLGSDSHAIIDPLVEARTVELQDRARQQRRGIHRAQDLLAMATSAGHHSLGWADAGAISPTKRADLTTISLASTSTAGASPSHGVEAAIFAATTADITSVVVDGKQIVSDGRHTTIDTAAELAATINELLL